MFEQCAQVEALLQAQADLFALQAVQAMTQAAAAGGIDFATQHPGRQFAFAGQSETGLTGFVQRILGVCYR
ncbi:hypothetical protein D3C76_1679290 [compost metagenome]